METVILIIHCLVAVFLITTILLQSGKGADIGAAFGAGSSQTVFGPRGATTILSKITIGSALIFLVTSLTLAHFSRQEAESVLEAVPETVQETMPVSPAEPTPTTPPEEGTPAATGTQ
jgi:preprotein translocase subunit SecG